MRTVAGAGAIGVGVILSWYDTTIANGTAGLGRYEITRFRPQRWLRGSLPLRTMRFVSFLDDRLWVAGETSRPGWRSQTFTPSQPSRVIVYLDDLTVDPPAPAATLLGAAQRTSRWAVRPPVHEQEEPRIQGWTAELEVSTRRAIARQQPDSLLDRATTIVIATLPSRAEDGVVPVDQVLRGKASHGAVRVRFVASWLAYSRGRHLLLLASAQDGVLEPVSLDAGVVPLEGRARPAWARSTAGLRARIATSDERRAR